MAEHQLTFKIDPAMAKLLREEMRRQGRTDFRDFTANYVTEEFGKLGGLVESCSVSHERIRVTWVQGDEEPMAEIIAMLERGELAQAILLLELFLSESPDDAVILYNLGMAYSDLGILDKALPCLRHLLEVDPTHVNGRVALGVAMMRHGDSEEAVAELRRAAEDDPTNPWAQRNLGASLLKAGKATEGADHMRRATELNPEDVRAWYDLGQAYEQSGDDAQADQAYTRAMDADEYGEVAKLARAARRRIAERSFRAVTPGILRMDAVMYCANALEKFESMSPGEMQRIAAELAMLGSRGLDPNDATPKYSLRSLPGQFSALQLVSYLYVALKKIAPDQDIGFDLSAEYEAAIALHGRSKSA